MQPHEQPKAALQYSPHLVSKLLPLPPPFISLLGHSPCLLLHIDTPSKFVSPPQVSSTAQQQIKTFNIPKRKEDEG